MHAGSEKAPKVLTEGGFDLAEGGSIEPVEPPLATGMAAAVWNISIVYIVLRVS